MKRLSQWHSGRACDTEPKDLVFKSFQLHGVEKGTKKYIYTLVMLSSSSTVVGHLTLNPKVKASNPTSCKGWKKWQRNIIITENLWSEQKTPNPKVKVSNP